MSDITLDWIWSEYTTSPDCAAGMQCLQQTCSALYKHVLLPTHIVLSGGGFSLHPDLAQLLTNVVPPLGRLLDLALRSAGLPGAQFFCQTELHLLTFTTGLEIATQNQVVWNWIHLIDKVYVAMVDLKSLRYGQPLHTLGHERPSRMREILASLPLPLLVKLPADFLRSHGISIAKARDAVHRVAQEHERGSTHSRSRSPQQDSHAWQNCAEAGGPASPQATAADGSVESVSPAAMGTAAADAPRIRSSPCGGATGPATRPLHTSDLVIEYTAGPDSVYERAKEFASKNTLDRKNIVDRGDCNGSPHVGRFGLESSLFVRVDKTVTEMQALLIKASSLAGRSSHFIIDPRREAIQTLRGTADLPLLRVVWDGLVERTHIARDAFELHLSGHTTPDPVHQACDAAALRRMEALAKEGRMRRAAAAGARTERERSEVTQPAAVVVPERSPLRPPACVPGATEQPQAPSHPVVKAVSLQNACASGHAPTPAIPTSVKDPPRISSSRGLFPLAATPSATESLPKAKSIASTRARKPSKEAQATSIVPALKRSVTAQEVRTATGHAPTPAVPAAVKDPPSMRALVHALPVHPIGDLVSDTTVEDTENAPAPTVPATVHDPPNQSPCMPLQAAERESVALVAAIDEAVDKLGGPSDSDTRQAVDPLGLKDMVAVIDQQRNVSKEETRTSEPLGQSSSVLLQACLHECAAPSTVELGGLDATNPHGTVDSRKVDSETDEECVGWKGEETRTWNPVEFASGSFLEHCALRVPFPLTSSSPSDSSPSASVIAYLDFALVSAILRTFWTTYLVWIKCEDASPCLAWEREGIGTGPWN